MSDGRIKLADESEFDGDGSRVITEVSGQEIAVIRYDGEYHALANYCIHQSGPLCEGGMTGVSEVGDDGWDWVYDADRKYISCPWHGWTFDVTTGDNVNDDTYSVPTFGIEVEGGSIYLA